MTVDDGRAAVVSGSERARAVATAFRARDGDTLQRLLGDDPDMAMTVLALCRLLDLVFEDDEWREFLAVVDQADEVWR